MAEMLPNVPLFPENDAKIVKRAARLALYEPAIHAVNDVKQMLGHPGNVQRVVRAWETSSSKMANSLTHVSSAHGEVVSHWDGAAFRAFTVYVTDAKTRINFNVTQLQGAATNTINMYLGVMESYKNAITFVSKCASIILRFGGGLLDNLEDLVGLATAAEGGAVLLMGHIVKALADMVDNITDLMGKVVDTTAKYNSAMQAAQNNFLTIKAPAGPGGDVNRLNSWTAK